MREMRIAVAAPRLAQDDPYAATAALASVLDGAIPVFWRTWLGHMSARREDRLTPAVPAGQPATASTRP